MRTIQANLSGNVNYFGTGTTNSDEFIEFANRFNKSFNYEISKIGGTNLKVSVGHFYLSGFFTVNEQILYFSISDVRSFQTTDYKGNVQMLIRTAESYKDFSGGQNRYITIEPNMSKKFINLFKLNTTFEKPKSKVKNVEELADLTIENGELDLYLGSAKKASKLMFKLLDKTNSNNNWVTERKMGKFIDSISCDCKEFEAYYSGESKRIQIKMNKDLQDKD